MGDMGVTSKYVSMARLLKLSRSTAKSHVEFAISSALDATKKRSYAHHTSNKHQIKASAESYGSFNQALTMLHGAVQQSSTSRRCTASLETPLDKVRVSP